MMIVYSSFIHNSVIIYFMAVYNSKAYNLFTAIVQYITMWLFLRPFYYAFFRIKIHGKGNIPKNKSPFIVMPNHISYNDPPLVSVVLNIPIAYMTKEELFRIPFLNSFLRLEGAFSVNREKVEKTTIKASKEILAKNWCVGIFLEGTRSKTKDVLGEPHVGAAYIANLNNVPILPVGIVGSDKLFGQITIRIGNLFYPDKDLETAKWQCAKKLAELTGFKLPER